LALNRSLKRWIILENYWVLGRLIIVNRKTSKKRIRRADRIFNNLKRLKRNGYLF